MASTVSEASSSSHLIAATPRLWTYDVFLSFRGEDTRKGFTDHLCSELERKGIRTFRDDKDLDRGDVISSELRKAIEASMFAIIVLSPNYASSTWCLDELHHIVECSNKKGLQIVPIFYRVEPSDVRYQKGSYEESFRKHEGRFGQGNENIKRWKDALAQIASHSGWDSKDQHEARLVESIAEHIHRKLIPKLPSCTTNLVGIASRMEEVIRLIEIGVNDVRFVGIWGMGGIGKTTISRTVYDAIKGKFKVSCFVKNVTELSEKNGLVHLQRDILSCLNISCGFLDEEDGRNIIQNSLWNKNVLLVLDDVSEEIQLENLAGEQNWFGPGSRIIITTRDKHVLNKHGVHTTYEVKGLDEKDAYHLFCLKAFQQNEPSGEYSYFSKEVVKYTKGLPLAIKVLSSYLYGKGLDFWQDTIKELMSGTHLDIVKVLRISVDRLSPTERGIFLDIACFFKGEQKDEVIHILKMCNSYVGIGSGIGSGIDTLIDKSLVTLNQREMLEMYDVLQETGRQIILEMHDLLQETARQIIFEESSTNNPGERSRLWSRKDVYQVLKNDMGTDKIQSIDLRSAYDHWSTDTEAYEAAWSSKAFSKTRQLKFLRLNGRLPCRFDYLPTSVKVLRWSFFPFEALPLADQPYELVEIQLHSSGMEQLWHGRKLLPMLKYLDLSCSSRLKVTPDVSALPILETLILRSCIRLIKLHPSLADHDNLVLLNLDGCSSLRTLPDKLKMRSLKELILNGCSGLKNLPEFGECMKHLSTLSLERTAIREVPTSVGYLVGLQCLNLYCSGLIGLPDSINQLNSLRTLNASWSRYLRNLPSSVSSLFSLSTLDLSRCNLYEESFPHDFCHLSSLTHLDLSYNPLTSLPRNIHHLPKLRFLSVSWCENIQFLPELPSSIRKLEAIGCDSLDITQLISLSTSCNIIADSPKGVRLISLVPGIKPSDLFSNLHREHGNCVSLPPRAGLLLSEFCGIVLCFQVEIFNCGHGIPDVTLVVCWNGETLATRKISPETGPGPYLYELGLTSHSLSGDFQEGDIFEMSIESGAPTCAKVLSSAANWRSYELWSLKQIEGEIRWTYD